MQRLANDNCDYHGGYNWAINWINATPTTELAQIARKCGNCDHSQPLNCVLKGKCLLVAYGQACWMGRKFIQVDVRSNVSQPGTIECEAI